MSERAAEGSCLSENLLGAWLEGRLGGEAEAEVMRHLDGCHLCRTLVIAATNGEEPEGAAPDAAGAATAGDDPVLAAGASAGRYQIRRLLGVGGMGSVYLAYDPRLDREVALKLLPPAGSDAESEELRARILGEAQAMARLSHPHVTHVHDVDDLGGRLAIAMEYVDGPTLRQWLRERRRAPREVMAVMLQAGAGLAAAHAAGLVHRDFKPDNVLIGHDGVARVTDFGVARRVTEQAAGGAEPVASDGGRSVPPGALATRTGTLVGTPAYMAPEQLEGHAASAQSDCFAFAVTLYEALHDERPFPGHTVEELRAAIRRGQVGDAPAGSRVPPPIRRVLLRALASDPAARFPSVTTLLAALDPPRRTRLRAPVAVVAASAAALTLITVGVLGARARSPVPAGGGVGQRLSVAVLGFRADGVAPAPPWLCGALQELLTAELGAGERLAMRSGDTVARMKMDLALTEREQLPAAELARVRSYLGVDYAVVGSCGLRGERARLEARLQDTRSGAVVAVALEEGEAGAPLPMAARAAERLRGRLGLGPASAGEARAIGAAFPSDPEAVRLYVEGLERLRAFDLTAAAERFEAVARLAPDHAPVHAALARVHYEAGRAGESRAAAQRAYDLSSALSREERLSIEALYHERQGQPARAAEIDRALWTFFPDKIDYGLDLASNQIRAGTVDEALRTVDALRRLPEPASRDPRITIAEANAYAQAADYQRAAEAGRRAADAARAVGARLAEAHGHHVEARALLHLGDARATALLQDLQRRFHELGAAAREAKVANDLGIIALDRGDLDGAERRFQEVLQLARSVGDDNSGVAATSNLAEILHVRGEVDKAQALLEEQLAHVRLTPNHWAQGPALLMLGDVRRQRGDLAGAERAFEEGFRLPHDQGNHELLALNRLALAEVLVQRHELDRARAAADASIAHATATGSAPVRGQCRVALAAVLVAARHPAEAGVQLRQALAGLDGEHHRDERLRALVALVRAELAAGRMAEARRTVEEAETLRARTANRVMGLEVEMAAARVRGVAGTRAERVAARRVLAQAITTADARGLAPLALVARLDLGEIELGGGERAAGRARLSSLAHDASRRGYSWMARRAREAARGRHMR